MTRRVFVLQILIVLGAMFYSPALQAQSKALIVDLAEDHIDITTGFNGAHLTVFGVREKQGDVAVVIRGPVRSMIVRKKEQVLGAWLNSRSMRFRKVPAYYDYALSAPEDTLLPPEKLREAGIGVDSLYFEPDYSKKDPELVRHFQEALIRTKQLETVYPVQPRKVRFLNKSLFRTEFYVPANVPPGNYTIHTFLIQDQAIIDRSETELRVAQVGFSAMLYNLAYEHSFLYGLLCVFIAIMTGFGINMLRR